MEQDELCDDRWHRHLIGYVNKEGRRVRATRNSIKTSNQSRAGRKESEMKRMLASHLLRGLAGLCASKVPQDPLTTLIFSQRLAIATFVKDVRRRGAPLTVTLMLSTTALHSRPELFYTPVCNNSCLKQFELPKNIVAHNKSSQTKIAKPSKTFVLPPVPIRSIVVPELPQADPLTPEGPSLTGYPTFLWPQFPHVKRPPGRLWPWKKSGAQTHRHTKEEGGFDRYVNR